MDKNCHNPVGPSIMAANEVNMAEVELAVREQIPEYKQLHVACAAPVGACLLLSWLYSV